MLQQLKNMKENFWPPLKSAGIVLLFFLSLIVTMWLIMLLTRLILG